MELNVTVRREGNACVVGVDGEVDIYTAPQLDEKLVEVLEDGEQNLIIDLSHVAFLDSTGLGVLVKALKRCREAGGSLSVVAKEDRITKVFRITGLDAAMPVKASVAEAL